MKEKDEIKEKVHFVFGYRDYKKIPFRHRIANIWWNFLFNHWIRKRDEPKMNDVACGYVALSPEAVDYLAKQKDWVSGYNIDAWIKLKALQFGRDK